MEAPVLVLRRDARPPIDPEKDMVCADDRALLRELYVGDSGRRCRRKPRGEPIGQELPDRRRTALVSSRLDGHHDRGELNLHRILLGGHRQNLPQTLAELSTQGPLKARAQCLPEA
jgi:hypothetical protein